MIPAWPRSSPTWTRPATRWTHDFEPEPTDATGNTDRTKIRRRSQQTAATRVGRTSDPSDASRDGLAAAVEADQIGVTKHDHLPERVLIPPWCSAFLAGGEM